MIDLGEAVSKSLEALKGIPTIPASAELELEEAELEDNIWTLTFSYPDPKEAPSVLGPNLAALFSKKRAYKAIRLLASDGSVRGVKSIHV